MGERDMQTAVQCKKCGKSYSAGVVNNDFQGLCPSCVAAFAFEDVSQSPLEAPQGMAPPPDYEKTTMYLKPGTTFQGVVIETVLGQGGMGVVYKAKQLGLDRPVAVKVMSDRLAGDAEFVKRFEKEAKAMAALSHANIVAVYNYGIDNGRCFIVMEYVDGANLRLIIREKKLRPEEALKIVPQLCDALDYAHSEGVVHRDIKPENILIDKKGRVKITDFGLAKMVEPGRHDHTVTGLVMGTPHYMAPEQVESPKDVDHRADIYSMGVVFYELLTGELPIGRWQLPSHRGAVDARLDQVVLRALEKQPDKRYQHASEMKVEVSRVSEFIPVARLAPLQPTGVVAAGGVVVASSPSGAAVSVQSPAAWNPPQPLPAPLGAPRSHMSGWVGTGFGLTLGAIVMGTVGLICAGAEAPMAALVTVFSIAGVLASVGFLCTTIGLFDILFNSGRRHGFGMAILTYALDILLVVVGIVCGFLMARPVMMGREVEAQALQAMSEERAAFFMKSVPPTPAGWNLANGSRLFERPEDMTLFWRTANIPKSSSVRRARRLNYVMGDAGGSLTMTILELKQGSEPEGALLNFTRAGDSSLNGNILVIYEILPPDGPRDERGVNELKRWVAEGQGSRQR